MRFINDVFFVCMHEEVKLKSFIIHLNSSHKAMKFTNKPLRNSISFSDVQVSAGKGEPLRQTFSASQLKKGIYQRWKDKRC